MMRTDEELLRAHFERLRAHDLAHTPAFRAVVQDARARSTTVHPRPAWLASLAAAALVVLSLGIAIYQRRVEAPIANRGTPTVTITTWKSPTDGLLRISGQELFAPPSVLSSVLDGATRSALPRKGD